MPLTPRRTEPASSNSVVSTAPRRAGCEMVALRQPVDRAHAPEKRELCRKDDGIRRAGIAWRNKPALSTISYSLEKDAAARRGPVRLLLAEQQADRKVRELIPVATAFPNLASAISSFIKSVIRKQVCGPGPDWRQRRHQETDMLSLDAAYDVLIQAAANSARQKDHRTTTSLAPELGLRELAYHKHQRGYERHDGGRSLLLMWRESADDLGHTRQFLTVALLEEGITLRRQTVDFAG